MGDGIGGRRSDDVEMARIEGTLEDHGRQLVALIRDGCAHRVSDDRRLFAVEHGMDRMLGLVEEDRRSASIFREDVLRTIGEIRVDIRAGVDGAHAAIAAARIWGLVGVLSLLLCMAGWLVDRFVLPALRVPAPIHSTGGP